MSWSVGEATLDLMGDLAADKEFKFSTDSVQTHRAWIDRREGGAPVTMLGDMTGNMARMFGVMDTTTHTEITKGLSWLGLLS